MANETSGEFLDPAGHLMPLHASSPEAFRILVTRKLAAGWKQLPEAPKVEPLRDESQLALPPPPYEVVIESVRVDSDPDAVVTKVAKRTKRTDTPEE